MTAIEALQACQTTTASTARVETRITRPNTAHLATSFDIAPDLIGFDEAPCEETHLAIEFAALETARTAMANREAEYQRLSTHAYLRR